MNTSAKRALTGIAFLAASIHLAPAHAQGHVHRYHLPGVTYESSSAQRNLELRAPGVRYRVESLYPNGRAAYDRAYERAMDRLRQGGPVTGPSRNIRDTTSTLSVGGTVYGAGYEQDLRSRSAVRSAEDDARRMWDRTEHLRRLERINGSRVRSGGGVK